MPLMMPSAKIHAAMLKPVPMFTLFVHAAFVVVNATFASLAGPFLVVMNLLFCCFHMVFLLTGSSEGPRVRTVLGCTIKCTAG